MAEKRTDYNKSILFSNNLLLAIALLVLALIAAYGIFYFIVEKDKRAFSGLGGNLSESYCSGLTGTTDFYLNKSNEMIEYRVAKRDLCYFNLAASSRVNYCPKINDSDFGNVCEGMAKGGGYISVMPAITDDKEAGDNTDISNAIEEAIASESYEPCNELNNKQGIYICKVSYGIEKGDESYCKSLKSETMKINYRVFWESKNVLILVSDYCWIRMAVHLKKNLCNNILDSDLIKSCNEYLRGAE